MNIKPVIIATTLAVVFTGCAGMSPTRLVGNTVGVAGGGLLGSTLGKRNPLATAAGAGAGLVPSTIAAPVILQKSHRDWIADWIGVGGRRGDRWGRGSDHGRLHRRDDRRWWRGDGGSSGVAGGAALAGSSMSGSPYSPGGGMLSSLASQRRPKQPVKDDLSGDQAVRELLTSSRN